MKKNFNNTQALGISEIKNKFSKSVSYETLVGGTATIGTEIKQTRQLIKGNAVKPLSAVGTLTSLLCNSAKVMENLLRHVITRRTSVRRGYLSEQCTHANQKSLFTSVTCFMRLPRRIQRMLLVMTIPVLAIIFILIIISESQAEETSTIVTGTCNDDETCLWKFDTSTGKMTISAAQGTGKVSMKNYYCNDSTYIGNRPWENYIKQIKDIVVEENVTNIGNEAFQNARNLETLTGMKDVKTIGFDSFAYSGGKLRLVELPSVEVIDRFNGLFGGQITSVDLPNIKEIYPYFGKNIEYVGLPDWNVKMPENAFAYTKIPNCSNENHAACGSCGNDYVKRGVGCVKDCGEGYLGKEGRCIDSSLSCGTGYRQFENFCNRIQYTPAEAAQVLHNDNTNSVTITFKK